MVGGRFYINHPDRDQLPSTMAIDPQSINQLDQKPGHTPQRTCSLTVIEPRNLRDAVISELAAARSQYAQDE